VPTTTPAFPVRVFRTPEGYLAWADGVGTVEGRTLAETRRAARRLVETVVAGAFPDRPAVDRTGTWEILEFRLEVRLRPRAHGSPRMRSVAVRPPVRAASGASEP